MLAGGKYKAKSMEYNGGLMVLKFISMNMHGSAVPLFTNMEFNSGP